MSVLRPPLRSTLRSPLYNPLVGKWGAGFDPASLFANGEPGFAIDTMSASALGVSAIGDTIASATDLSPNAKHAAQATAANRPWWDGQGIVFDGTNDSLVTPAIDFSGCDRAMILFGGMKNADVATQILFELTATAVSNDGGFFVTGANAAMGAGLRGTTFVSRNFNSWQQSNLGVHKVVVDISGATAADELQYEINGNALTGTGGSGTNAGTGNLANAAVYIGRRNQASFPASATIMRPIVIGYTSSNPPSAEAIANAIAWIEEAVEQRAAYSDTPTAFSDSAEPVEQGGYLLTSPFAHADYTTEATVLDVDVISDFNSPSQIGIGVYVDGAYLRNCAPQGNGTTRHRVYLAAGSKTISIVNGIQGRTIPDPVMGVFVKSIHADKALTRTFPTPTDRILIYGDSIAVGGNALPVVQNAWALLLRGATTRSVALEAYGSRTLHLDANTSQLRAAFVAKMAAYAPATIILAIGTNDYGLARWSAADFGTAYAAVLDDLNTALPSAEIYCQTPLVRTSEVANSFGDTLGAYRTAISDAVSTRTSFATLVDGSTIITTGDLDDTVHPDTAGHALIAAHYETLLGL